MQQHDMTAQQLGADGKPQWALFLPAISGFYSTFISKQRQTPYVPQSRMPTGIPDMEMLNFLNSQQGLFHYQWGLYSAGHADMDLSRFSDKDDLVRTRDPNTVILGDSGGFQIAKGVWDGDWKDPHCPRAKKRRESVLKWLDHTADYSMTLDIPTWITQDAYASQRTGITTYAEAVAATQFNNEYFMANRLGVKNGGTRFLNVLQGSTHSEADDWYERMKKYCDPTQYEQPFEGWAMGGQNMADPHLILRRLVTLREQGLLETGLHDWMHFLGISKLEWAVLLTAIQRAVRRYHNPNFTISFDCASPFLATANGQIYTNNIYPHLKKWSYRMKPSVDDKKYATDTRPFAQAVVQDGLLPEFESSPVMDRCTIRDICIYRAGVKKSTVSDADFDPANPEHYEVLPDVNRNGKWGRTSWDSFSYMLQMTHNVYKHIQSVQEANQLYDSGIWPSMAVHDLTGELISDVVDRVFATADYGAALDIIERNERLWHQVVGGRGYTGRRATNSNTNFNQHFAWE
jgi:queuine/archaeosine tRNA-ribosyltransferase